MSVRITPVFSPVAVAVLGLGAGAAPACSHQAPEAQAAAAPASTPADSPQTEPARTDAADTSAAGAPAATPSPAAPDSQYLQYDAPSNTVTFRLVAGPFTFNGFSAGGATLTVPPRSNNVINFEQNDGTPHSTEIATGTGPIPNSGGDPAIPRAYTNKVVEGLPQGATDVIRFAAPDTGIYRIICGVPGHALSGMWIWYKVDPSAKAPRFGPSK